MRCRLWGIATSWAAIVSRVDVTFCGQRNLMASEIGALDEGQGCACNRGQRWPWNSKATVGPGYKHNLALHRVLRSHWPSDSVAHKTLRRPWKLSLPTT